MRPPSSDVLVRSAREATVHYSAPKEYTSLDLNHHRIRMYMQDEIRPVRPTLDTVKRAKSLASIRLMAATKMRVRSSKSNRQHLYHPIPMEGRYRKDAFITNPLTGARQLAINVKLETPNPFEGYLSHPVDDKRCSRASVATIDQVKREIQEELRKRELLRKKMQPNV